MSDTEPKSARVEVLLHDLEVLLKENLGNSLVVDSFTTNDLIPPGENYASTMLRVDVLIRQEGQGSEPQELFLVAKMAPPTKELKVFFDSPMTFKKEIYMFKEIIPAYKDLERECGIPEAEVFDLLPKFYGARLSLDTVEEKFDDDHAVILLENLKARNYACGNRNDGCDLAHAKSVVMALARFHAIGIAAKLKKPELFEQFKIIAKPANPVEEFFVNSHEFIMSKLEKIPALLSYLPRIKKMIGRSNSDYHKLDPVFEPWGTIGHGDFWINNVMFRDDGNGDPEDVKFIDFQAYTYFSPMRDLVLFLFASCGREVHTAHIEDLCNLYYENFTSHLARLQCDVNPFSKHSFDQGFAHAANLDYIRCMFFSRIVTIDAETDLADSLLRAFEKEYSEECMQRMTDITLKFIKENWI